jgi:hypothetical protein
MRTIDYVNILPSTYFTDRPNTLVLPQKENKQKIFGRGETKTFERVRDNRLVNGLISYYLNNMTNLLKQISLIVLFLTGGIRPACQNFKHHLTFPIGTIQVTNVPGFQFDISSTYVNNFYLPNIKYTIEWNKFIFGVEHYNFYKYIGYEREVDGAITGMNTYSYSAFIGMGSKINKFNFNLGTGLSYLNHYIS